MERTEGKRTGLKEALEIRDERSEVKGKEKKEIRNEGKKEDRGKEG